MSILCSLFKNNIDYLQSTKQKPEAGVFESERKIVQSKKIHVLFYIIYYFLPFFQFTLTKNESNIEKTFLLPHHRVRQTFFSHLEERFHITLTNTITVVEAKKRKLKDELDLRLQLHQPRAARIEMDIHNVRAGLSPHHIQSHFGFYLFGVM